MIKTFTRHDLIRFVYEETTEAENSELMNACLCNTCMYEELNELNSVTTILDKIILTPSKCTIDKILNYSKNINFASCI